MTAAMRRDQDNLRGKTAMHIPDDGKRRSRETKETGTSFR